ncbi:MAG: methylated-DNA--[protein]-cysteine S-methyltransferase [Actinomycetota bacterium]|nr:methylated-DNA--[protein]-cysteine S-methyltransferase [Actinomycetota bacterium]
MRFEASASPCGIRKLLMPPLEGKKFSSTCLETRKSPGVEENVSHFFDSLGNYLETSLSGRNPTEIPPLDFKGISNFSRSAYEVVMNIAWGETASYQGVASMLGREKAARAVGRALASNPLPILIPCHRVICADGQLGGYNFGLEWKKLLLGLESRERTGED